MAKFAINNGAEPRSDRNLPASIQENLILKGQLTRILTTSILSCHQEDTSSLHIHAISSRDWASLLIVVFGRSSARSACHSALL